MSPARFRWGMLFILTGVIILLVNLDVLNWNFIRDLFFIFALLLITIGIEKIFAHTKLKVISYASSLVFVSAVLFFAVQTSSRGNTGDFFDTQTIRETMTSDLRELQAKIRLGESSLTIRDATDYLVYGRFAKFSSKPRYDYRYASDGLAEVQFTSPSARGSLFGGAIVINNDDQDDWRLSFSRELPLSLECTGHDNEVHLNLSTTPLRDLNLDVEEAEVYVKVGNLEPLVKLFVAGSDSRVRLRFPSDAGIKISGEVDSGYLTELGFEAVESYYLTTGFDSTEHQIEVDLQDDFRSLSIDFY